MATHQVALTSIPQKYEKIKKLLLEGHEILVTHRWQVEFRLELFNRKLQESVENINHGGDKLLNLVNSDIPKTHDLSEDDPAELKRRVDEKMRALEKVRALEKK